MTDLSDLKIEIPGYWYLGSPYSKYPRGIDYAFKDICVISGVLLREGIRVFSPIAHSHSIAKVAGMDPYDHVIWMWADEPMMENAHGLIVAMMETWKESKGLMEEIKFFEETGKPVYFIDPKEDLGL